MTVNCRRFRHAAQAGADAAGHALLHGNIENRPRLLGVSLECAQHHLGTAGKDEVGVYAICADRIENGSRRPQRAVVRRDHGARTRLDLREQICVVRAVTGCEDKLAEIAALDDFDIKLDELADSRAFAQWAHLPNWETQVSAEEFLDIACAACLAEIGHLQNGAGQLTGHEWEYRH